MKREAHTVFVESVLSTSLNGNWIEVGEAGEAHPALLQPGYSGLATGWGLDRLAMLVKGIDDIRFNLKDGQERL